MSESERLHAFIATLDNALSVGNDHADKPGLKGWYVRKQNRDIRRFRAYLQQRLSEMEMERVEA